MKATIVLLLRSNKAISKILLFAVGSILYAGNPVIGQVVTKPFYLSDPSQSLDRVDPVATADATTAQTAALTPTSQYLYALRGASRTDFWRYNISSNSWSAMAATPGTISRGGSLASDGTYIYALRGAATDFWRYNTSTNAWTAMSTTPAGVLAGAALVHVSGALYAFRGGANPTFWKYTISTNTWSILANAPANVDWGAALTTDGNNIYATRGAASSSFWRYNVASNTWTALTNAPANIDGGGSLSFDGTNVYALRGSSSNNFYRYNVSSNTWTTLSNTASAVFKGGSLVCDDPYEYAMRGASQNNFWRYNGTSWSSMNNTPSNVDSGAALIKFGVTGQTTTFTVSPSFCSAFVVKAGTITVSTYTSIVYGSMPANPSITAVLRYGGTNIITLSNPTYNSTTGLLTWTGTLAADATIPAAQTMSLDITTTQRGVSFRIEFDSQTKPSKIVLQTSSRVNISSVAVYSLPYPLGTPLLSILGGTTRYIRTTVTNPTGFGDIRSADVTVTPPGTSFTSTQVAAAGCTKVFESSWLVPVGQPSFTIRSVTKEGYENVVIDDEVITISGCSNCPPTANEDYATGNGGEPLEIDVLANDSDPNNDIDQSSLTVTVEPKNGSVIIDNNKITYLPNGTFQGNDTLTYEICDNSFLTPQCATAKVILTVLPVAFNTCSDAAQPKTYYMPYAEDQAQIALRRSASDALPTTNIRTIISIKISYPNMNLVWDHWEDGYETNISAPTQSSTQIWGDGNIYNGIAPGYANDIIPPGGSIVLDNTMATPRVASNIFYDGKDKLYSSGQISVTQVCGEPATIAVQCMKTNVTSYPNEYGKSFTIPVGQDLPSRDFRYTALFIRAAENNTTIRLDRNNDGIFNNTIVLNEGQVAMIDGNTVPATPIYAGAVITSDKPIGVDAHFAGVDKWSSREVPVFPATWYSNVYYTPVPTTGPGTTGVLDTAVVMLYNSLSRSININWSSGVPSSGVITLQANSSYRFPMPLSLTAAYKFENPTKESFVAIEIVDSYAPGNNGSDGTNRDWAFNLISEARLTDFASVAWAPGSVDMTRNDNPIWVTPSVNTTVYVKYDGDILNGVNTSPCGMKYDIAIPVNALKHIKIRDAADNNQSGTAVYTCNGAKLAAVYGEDPQTAVVGDPSWDVGSTIQPFCKDKLIIANDDYGVTMVNTPVTISVIKNDAGFLAIVDAATVNTTGLLQPLHGTLLVNANGSIIYIPNTGYVGVDTFQYSVCSTPTPVVCDVATVYITIGSCPSPSGKNILAGQVFLDKNSDGNKNDDGTGFYPAKVYLYVDGNCNNSINTNELVDSADVDINGNYQFVKAPEKIIADNFDVTTGGNSCSSGSDGNAAWRSNWYDNGDASSAGFCVTPAQTDINTDVEIVQDGAFGYALRLDDASKSAIREFNMINATQAFISFSYRKATNSLSTGENIFVQLSSDGSTYNTIYTIAGNSTSNATYVDVPNINILAGAYNGNSRTYLRFISSSNTDEGDHVFIDKISIKFLQYDQCYLVGFNTAILPANTTLTTPATRSFTFNNAGTCTNAMDFGIKRIITYAVNDENSTWRDVNVSGMVKINDFDQEGNTQTFGTFLNPVSKAVIASGSTISGLDKTGAVVANAGTITFTAAGNFTFDPSPTFTGTVNIPYSVCDNGSPAACDTAYLAVTVDPLPSAGNAVIANNDEDISYGEAITGNLLVNDRDPKYNYFTVTLFSYDSNGDAIPDISTMPGTITVSGIDIYGKAVANAGTLTINTNGNYTFTPAAGFTGSADASYVITNTAGAVSRANIHFDVLTDINGIQNDPPFAGDDFGYTTINKPVSGSFINNDREPNNDTISFNGTMIIAASMANAIGSPVATTQGGTVQFYSNGTYTYIPPTGFTGPDMVTYSICDVTANLPQPLCASATLHLLVGPGISISGKVWDDGNGNVIPELSTEVVTNASNTLYVNLVDALGYVIATVPVAANGTYSFADVAPGLSYSLILSTVNGVVGTPAPNAALPAGWANTGETRNGTLDYGTMGVIDSRAYGFTSAVNLDFGIEQTPGSTPFYVGINQPVIGQMITLNGAPNASENNGNNPPILNGYDPEDCTTGCELTNKMVVIDSIPSNSNLYYNGVLVTAGQLIINFNPSLLQVEITAATIGSKMTEFYYSFVDEAGIKDPVTAVYSLNWLTLLPVKAFELYAVKAGKNSMLNWKTISELNSDHFEIERSIDGRNYVKVGMNVAAAGNTDGEKMYQLSDDISSLQAPMVYYRVKLLDKYGKYAYSNVATVKLPENGAVIRVTPNPFISDITVNISVEENKSFGVRMMDMSGRVISNNTEKISKEKPTLVLRYLNNLVRGIYLVEITDIETSNKRVFKMEKAY